MRRIVIGSLIAVCLGVAGLVHAGASEVVTNPTPAVSASMSLAGSDATGFTWNVYGKVKPAYRGFGANVQLICQPYNAFGQGGSGVVYGATRDCGGDFCTTNVDACGNFSFAARVEGSSPQLDATQACHFVVHVDSAKQPSACSSGKAATPDSPPQDPNGTAACSGGLCPNSP